MLLLGLMVIIAATTDKKKEGKEGKDPHKIEFIYGKNSYKEKQGQQEPRGIDDAPNMNTNDMEKGTLDTTGCVVKFK